MDQLENAIDVRNASQKKSTLHHNVRMVVTPGAISEIPRHGFGVRHIQTLMAFSCLSVNVFLQVNMSIGVISMTGSENTSRGFPVYKWSEQSKDTILSSFFWGYLVLQIIVGNLAEIYGAKIIMAVGMVAASLSNMAIPLVAVKGVNVVCWFRAFQGAVQGIFFPCVAALLSKWLPPAERPAALSFTYSGAILGAVGVFPLSGYLAGSALGWPSIFYVTSGIAFAWTLVWLLVGASRPGEHTFISRDELQYIETTLSGEMKKKKVELKTPWKEIWTSVPVWALVLAHIGQNWGYWTLITEMPKYINSVFGINIRSNGVLSATPYLFAWVLAVIYAWAARVMEHDGIMSKTSRIKFWNSIALWGSALILLIHALSDPKSWVVVVILMTLTQGMNAAINNGLFATHVELSPNFSGTLMGITNSIATVASIVGPLTVGWFVREPESAEAWVPVFLLASAVMFLTNLFFVLFGTAKKQSWDDPTAAEHAESRDSK